MIKTWTGSFSFEVTSLCWTFYVLSPLDITICIMLLIKRDWLLRATFFLCHHWTVSLLILCSSQCKNTFVRCCCSVALLSGLVWGWRSFCWYCWAVWTCRSIPGIHYYYFFSFATGNQWLSLSCFAIIDLREGHSYVEEGVGRMLCAWFFIYSPTFY